MSLLKYAPKTGRRHFVRERKKRKRERKIKGLTIRIAVFLLLAILFININPLTSFITKQIIIYQIEKRVTFKVSCKSLKADIFTDRVIIEGAKIVSSNQFGEEPFIYIPRIEGYFRYKSLFKKKIIMDDFIYYQPEIFLECNPKGEWNFPDKKKYKKGRWFFTQSHWRVKEGRLVIKDGWVSEEPFSITFENIEVRATNFSNRVPSHGRYLFQAQLVSSGPVLPIEGKGRVESFKKPVDHTLYLEAKDLDLPYFNPYQKRITPFNLTKGKMDLKTELAHLGERFEGENSLKIKEIVLESPKEPVISCPKIEAKLFFQFLPEKRIILDDVTLSKPVVLLSRDKKGEWNLPSGEEEKETTWSLLVNSLEVKRGKVIFRDDKIPPKTLVTKLENIDLRLEHLSTLLPSGAEAPPGRSPSGAHYHLGALLNQSPLEAEGGIDSFRRPYNFDLDLTLEDLNLVHFDPYQRKLTSCRLVKGQMDLKTKLKCQRNLLEAENELLLSDLKLEPLVEMKPSSFKVLGMGPATLATILPDEKGEIRLSIPVTGSIDDPDFKFASALTQATLKSIQEKMIQPFKLATKLVPDKDGLTKIHFLPLEFVEGTMELTIDSVKRLTQLGSFLTKYPIALLHIEGYVDPVKEEGISAFDRAKKIADFFIQKCRIPLESLRLIPKEEKDKTEVEIKVEERKD